MMAIRMWIPTTACEEIIRVGEGEGGEKGGREGRGERGTGGEGSERRGRGERMMASHNQIRV